MVKINDSQEPGHLATRDGKDKTDEELVVLTLDNQSYFSHIIKRYEEKLLHYILRITNVSHEEAEDILQDVFIRVYENLRDFDSDLKFSSWIYRITHNQVIGNYRKNKARPQMAIFDLEEDILEKLASDLDLAKELDAQFLRKNIYQVLGRLNSRYQEILVLKYLEEKDYREISDIIKKPMGTVASLLNRAKQEFRKELEKRNIKI